jgi:hypothetical protein
MEEVVIVGTKGEGREEGKKKEREKSRKEKKNVGGEEIKWNKRGLRKLIFGQNGRGS